MSNNVIKGLLKKVSVAADDYTNTIRYGCGYMKGRKVTQSSTDGVGSQQAEGKASEKFMNRRGVANFVVIGVLEAIGIKCYYSYP